MNDGGGLVASDVGMIGANPAQLKALSRSLGRTADQLLALRNQIDRSLGTVAWRGMDASDFGNEWAGSHRQRLDAAVVGLQGAAAALVTQAQAQLQASAAEHSAAVLAPFGVPPHVPTSSDVEQTRRWWNSLSAPDRAWLITRRPDQIGAMDGVPASVRDQCNRALLAEAVTHCGEQATDKCKDIRALQRNLEIAEGNRQLISFSTTGSQVLAAVVVGDADTAKNIAVLVPGMSTDIDGEMGSLIQQASLISVDQPDMAVVAWLGYDTPTLSTQVMSRDRADAAAGPLSQFLIGLDDDRVPGRRISVFGHSYGSVVTALAAKQLAQQHSHAIDSAVFYGSPGLPIHSADELGISPGQVYTMRGPTDMVARFGYFGAPPEQIAGIHTLSSAGPEWKIENSLPITNHSHYIEDGVSLENFQRVAAGKDFIAPGVSEHVAGGAEKALGALAEKAIDQVLPGSSKIDDVVRRFRR